MVQKYFVGKNVKIVLLLLKIEVIILHKYFFLIFETLNTNLKECKVIIMASLKTSRWNGFSSFAGFEVCECILNLANLLKTCAQFQINQQNFMFFAKCRIHEIL